MGVEIQHWNKAHSRPNYDSIEGSCCLSHRQQCFLKTADCLNEWWLSSFTTVLPPGTTVSLIGIINRSFLNFPCKLCSSSRKILCSSCDINILASSTFPRVLLLLLVTWITVTTVYASWLNLRFTSIQKMKAKDSFETSVSLLTKLHSTTISKTSILIHNTHKTS